VIPTDLSTALIWVIGGGATVAACAATVIYRRRNYWRKRRLRGDPEAKLREYQRGKL